jgi:hypothetical protein
MGTVKCNSQHPTLDLKCDQTKHPVTVAHTAIDESGNPHAWVDKKASSE